MSLVIVLGWDTTNLLGVCACWTHAGLVHVVVESSDSAALCDFFFVLLLDDSVIAIWPGSDGQLWFATMGGISRYDGRRFVNYTQDDGLSGYQLQGTFADRQGQLWFVAGGGLCRFDRDRFVFLAGSDLELGIFNRANIAVEQGQMWLANLAGKLLRFDGEAFETGEIAGRQVGDLIHSTITCDYFAS